MDNLPDLIIKGSKVYKLGEYTVKVVCLNLCLFKAHVFTKENRLLFVTDTFTSELEATQVSFDHVRNITSLRTFLEE